MKRRGDGGLRRDGGYDQGGVKGVHGDSSDRSMACRGANGTGDGMAEGPGEADCGGGGSTARGHVAFKAFLG